MPKLIANVTRAELSYHGLVLQHSQWLNQSVRTTDNVAFQDTHVHGDLVVDGNMTVGGKTTLIETDTLRVKDQVIELNGSLDPLLTGGIQINRGPQLAPYLMVYNEATQSFGVGFEGNVHSVASRQDSGPDWGMAVWNSAAKRFDITDTVRIPATFTEDAAFAGTLSFGTLGNKATIRPDTAGNLHWTVRGDLNVAFTESTSSLRVPRITLADGVVLDGTPDVLTVTAADVRTNGKISWSDTVYLSRTMDSTLRMTAPRIEMNAPVRLNGPLLLANSGLIETTDTGIAMTSPGDLVLGGSQVCVPGLVVNGKARLSSDVAGNVLLESPGNVTLNPALNVIVPKRLCFASPDKSASVVDDRLVLFSSTDLVLHALGKVCVPTSLQIGLAGTVQEQGTDLRITTSSSLVLDASDVVVPNRLRLSASETIQSTNQSLVLGSSRDIVLDPGRQLVVPVNKILAVGSASVYGTTQHMYVDAPADLVLTAQSVRVPGGRLGLGLSTITDHSAGMAITSPGVTVDAAHVQLGGTLGITGDEHVQGSATVAGQLQVDSGASLGGGRVVVTAQTGAVPLQIHTPTDGGLVSLTAGFDNTAGYTLGRGTSAVKEGRSLVFTVPSASEYGDSGSVPAFVFGDTSSRWFMDVSSQVNVYVKMTSYSTAEDALNVPHGGAVLGSVTAGSLTVSGVLETSASGVRVTGTLQSDSLDADIADVEVLRVQGPTSLAGPVAATAVTADTLTAEYVTARGMDLSRRRITNVGIPSQDSDAATKAYVDQVAQGMSVKESVDAATTNPIDLSQSVFTLDDVVLAPGSRVMVKDQLDATENGIYTVGPDFVLSRAHDFGDGDTVTGAFAFVARGTANASMGYVVTAQGSVQVGTSPVTWTAFSGASQIRTGQGLVRTGTLLELDLDPDLEASPRLRISSRALGAGLSGGSGIPVSTSSDQSHVTQVGVISRGTWQGTPVSTQYGGTGMTAVARGAILYGGPGPAMESGTLVYTDGRLGVGTTTPSSSLHVVESGNAAVCIESETLAALQLKCGTALSQIGLTSASGMTVSASKIVLEAGQSKVSLSQSGTICLGTDTPAPGYTTTVAGNTYFEQDAFIGGTIFLAKDAQIRSGTQGVELAAACVAVDAPQGFSVLSPSSTFRNVTIQSTDGQSSLVSMDPSSRLPVPLAIKVGSSFTAAIAFNKGLLVPSVLQIGGTLSDGGYQMGVTDGALTITSRRPGSSVSFADPVNVQQGIQFGTAMDQTVQGTSVTYSAKSTDAYLNFGGGSHDLVSTFTNKDGTQYWRFDPLAAEVAVSPTVTSSLQGPVVLGESLSFSGTLSKWSALTTAGWYYLGAVSSGTINVALSSALLVKLALNGVQSYTVDLEIKDRDTVSMVLYKAPSDPLNVHVFVRVFVAPVLAMILESTHVLALHQYEGSNATPDGSYSGFSSTWVADYDTRTAQATGVSEVGSVVATGSLQGSSLTVSGTTSLGPLSVWGNAQYQGDLHEWTTPSGNELMALSADPAGHTLTVSTEDTSTPSFGLHRGSLTAKVSLNSVTSLTYPGSLMINHESLAPQSQIVLATRNVPHLVLNDQGTLTLLSTANASDTTGSLVVRGGALVNKKLVVRDAVSSPQVLVTHPSAPFPVTLSCTPQGQLSIGSSRITDVASPVHASDAVNKEYVDLVVQGASAKESVLAATVDPVDLSLPLTVVDGVLIGDGARVLVKNQSNLVENGIYVSSSGAPPVRAVDMDAGSSAGSVFVFVSRGATNANSGWLCTSPHGSDTVGVNPITFVQFSGAGQLSTGPGLAITGNQINVVVDDQSLELASGQIRIKDSVAGQGLAGGGGIPLRVASIAHLSEVGTLTQGTWNAGTIAMQYGGTGSTGFSAFSIPYSNGSALTQGPLVFDSDNVRLGINTRTPSQGLTLVDRNVQLTQVSGAAPNHIVLNSVTANYTFALKQNGTRLSVISGSGSVLSGLSERLAIDINGIVTCPGGTDTPFVNCGDVRFTGATMERTSPGPAFLSVFSLDNTGAATRYFGNKGSATNTTNTEYMVVGHVNGSFGISTAATGAGTLQDLSLGAGSSQLVLRSSGAVSVSTPLIVSATSPSTSIQDGGALTVAGGASIDGTLYAQKMVLTSTDSDAVSVAGGMKVTDLVLAEYRVSASASSLDVSSPGNLSIALRPAGPDGTSTNVVQVYSKENEWMDVGYDSHQYVLWSSSSTPLSLGTSGESRIVVQDTVTNVTTDLDVAGSCTVTSTQDSVSAVSGGALTVLGGASVAKTLYVGDTTTSSTLHASSAVQVSAGGSTERALLTYTTGGRVVLANSRPSGLDNQLVIGSEYAGESVSLGWSASMQSFGLTSGSRPLSVSSGPTGIRLASGLVDVTADQVQVSGGLAADSLAAKSLTVAKTIQDDHAVLATFETTDGVQNVSWTISTQDLASSPYTAIRSTVQTSFQDADGGRVLDIHPGAVRAHTSTVVSATSPRALHVTDAAGDTVFAVDTSTRTVDMAGCRVLNASAPSVATDLATKAYVDNLVKGLNLKEAVKAATVVGQNVNVLNPLYSVDGVSVVPGDRVLVKCQTNPVENGIYSVVQDNYLVRAADMASGSRAAGSFCFIQQGDSYADSGYVCTADYPDDITGTHPLTFTQFNGNVVSAGGGLAKDQNNVLYVDLDSGSGLQITGGKLALSPSIAGTGLSYANGTITMDPVASLGIVTQGTWRASPVELGFGGTGNSNFVPGSLVFATGSKLTNDASLFWDNSRKALGVGTSVPNPRSQDEGLTVTKDVSVYGALLLGDPDKYHWGIRRDAGSLVLSRGPATSKAGLSDVLVLDSLGRMGLGHPASSTLSATLDIHGSLNVTSGAVFGTALAVSSGGTGVSSLVHGLVLANGTDAFTSTGAPPDGGVPIGDGSGTFVIESGAVLRAHLGLAVGADVQAYHPSLDSLSAIVPSSGAFIVGDGESLVGISGVAARSAMGLGSLAVMNSVNNTVWSGQELAVAHGGTGTTGFAVHTVPYYDGTALADSGMYWDSALGGLGIGTLVSSGSALQVNKDVAIQADDAALKFVTGGGQVLWTLGRQGTSLVIAGGVPGSSKTLLDARLTVASSGTVTVLGTEQSTSPTTGCLRLGGGLGMVGNLSVAGDIHCRATSDSVSVGTGAMVVDGGLSIGKSLAVGGSATVTGSLVVASTSSSSSASTGALVVAGGLGLAKGLVSTGSAVFDQCNAGQLAAGLTVACNTGSWTPGSDLGVQNRHLALAAAVGPVALNMSTATGSWDVLVDAGVLSFQSNAGTSRRVLDVQPNGDSRLYSTSNATGVDNGGCLTLDGGLAVGKDLYVGSTATIVRDSNAPTALTVANHSATVSASSQVQWVNDVSSVTATYSSSNAGNGFVIQAHSQTDLAMVNQDDRGIRVDGTTGRTSVAALRVDSTQDASSTADGGAMTVSGGLAVAKKLYVGGDLIVAGTLSGTGNTASPSLAVASSTNATSALFKRSRIIRNGAELTLHTNVTVVPTVGSQFATVQFEVPFLETDIESPSDMIGIASGFTDNEDLVSVENIVCVGVPGTRRMILKFQARDTAAHHFAVCVQYSSDV